MSRYRRRTIPLLAGSKSPASLTGLALWYDASKIAGQVLVSDNFDRSRNLFATVDPSFETGGSFASAQNSTITRTTGAATRDGGTGTVFRVATFGLGVDEGIQGIGTALVPVAGQSYTLSCWVKGPAAATVYVVTRYATTGGTVFSSSPALTLTGSWQRLAYTSVAPAGTTQVTGKVLTISTTQSITFDVDDFQFEAGTAASPFTWGDGAHLGCAPTGQAWTLFGGSGLPGVVAGKAHFQDGGAALRTVLDTGSRDHYVSADIYGVADIGVGSGLIAGWSDATNYAVADYTPGTGQVRLFKFIANSALSITTYFMPANATPNLGLQVLGTTATVYYNGTALGSIDISDLPSGTQAGLRTNGVAANGVDFDNFTVTIPDLADGSPVSLLPDLSGNARHAVQTTAAARPLLRTTNKNLLPYSVATCSALGGFSASNGTLSVDAARSRSGGSSIKWLATGTTGGYFQNDAGGVGFRAPVTPGKTYVASAYVFIDPASPPTGGANVIIQYFNAAGSYINGFGVGAGSSTTTTGSWQRIATIPSVAPAGAAYANLAISTAGTTVASTTTVNGDDFQIEEANAATPFVLPVALGAGKPSIQFDGADDNLARLAVPDLVNVDFTIFTVSAKDYAVGNASVVSYTTNSGVTAIKFVVDWMPSPRFHNRTNTAVLNLVNGPDNGLANHAVVTDRKTGPLNEMFVNGTLGGSGSVASSDGATAADSLVLGARMSATTGGVIGNFFPGSVAEVIVYNRSLTDAERKTVEAYLKKKYQTP